MAYKQKKLILFDKLYVKNPGSRSRAALKVRLDPDLEPRSLKFKDIDISKKLQKEEL